MFFTQSELLILANLLETFQGIAEIGDPSGKARDEIAHLRRKLEYISKVIDESPHNFMSNGPCPFDVDGDGDCGQAGCQYCNPAQFQDRWMTVSRTPIYVATVENA